MVPRIGILVPLAACNPTEHSSSLYPLTSDEGKCDVASGVEKANTTTASNDEFDVRLSSAFVYAACTHIAERLVADVLHWFRCLIRTILFEMPELLASKAHLTSGRGGRCGGDYVGDLLRFPANFRSVSQSTTIVTFDLGEVSLGYA